MLAISLRSLVTCTLCGGVVLVACSSGDSNDAEVLGDSGSLVTVDSGGSNFEKDSGAGSAIDSGSPTGHDSGGSETSTAGSCSACTTNAECQSSCPAVKGGGTNCCDVGSGICYATTQATCLTPSDAGSE